MSNVAIQNNKDLKFRARNILQSYAPLQNEQLVCIENFDCYSYKTYAVYVNGQYDRKIHVSKN